MISSAGVGSGIDIESIISQLMTLERQPLNKLQTKKATLDVEVSAFGTLKGALSSLASAAEKLGDKTKFGEYIASSSDEDIFTATTTTGTAAEFHSVNVLDLAEAHRMKSDLFTDANAAVGEGTYSFSAGGSTFDVLIDSNNNTLTGLRDAINTAADNDDISASILNVDGGSRLVLTSKQTGTANSITAPAMFSELSPAVDAVLEVDGFTVTSDTNTVSGVIPGVTLNLQAEGSADLTTERNSEGLQAAMEEFVSAYNSVRSTAHTLYNGTLSGESMLRGIESNLRRDFFTPIEVATDETVSVFDMGFTFDKDGVLSLDESKLSDATSTDIEQLVKAFTDTDTGFGKRIEDRLQGYTQAGGLIENREDGIESRQRLIDQQMERLEYRLGRTEARYRKQFSAMDAMVAQLQSTSSYLASQLTALNQGNN